MLDDFTWFVTFINITNDKTRTLNTHLGPDILKMFRASSLVRRPQRSTNIYEIASEIIHLIVN